MGRSEYLAWAKKRALDLLPSNPNEAFMSMVSDLGKHPETAKHPALDLGMLLLLGGHLDTQAQMRKFIEGFN